MGRESARKDAAFGRGDVGVDGRETEVEERDEAEVEKDKAREELLRGRTWLGREFLTWLLWKSDQGDPVAEHDGEKVTVLYVGRVTLRGLHGDVVELLAKGTLAPYSLQVRRALSEGLLVHSARLRITAGERTWEASIDAEHLDIRSAKLPELLTEEEDDRVGERLDLTERLSAMLDAHLEAFLKVRASKAWSKVAVPELKEWMQGERTQKVALLDRARRVGT
jgi:hypothetical protein